MKKKCDLSDFEDNGSIKRNSYSSLGGNVLFNGQTFEPWVHTTKKLSPQFSQVHQSLTIAEQKKNGWCDECLFLGALRVR